MTDHGQSVFSYAIIHIVSKRVQKPYYAYVWRRSMSVREPELYCPNCTRGLPSISDFDFCPFCGAALTIGMSQEIKDDEAMVWFEWDDGGPFEVKKRVDERYIIEVEGKQGLLAYMYYKCCFALSKGKHLISITSIYKGKETNKEIIEIEVDEEAKEMTIYLDSRHNDNNSPSFIETVEISPNITHYTEYYAPRVYMLPPKDYYKYEKDKRVEEKALMELNNKKSMDRMRKADNNTFEPSQIIRIGECPNCHEMMREDANYCRKCGTINPLSN